MTDHLSPLLSIQDLTICVHQRDKTDIILHGINTNIFEGEIVAWVGNSGAGKTLLGMSLLGLLPQSISITTGFIHFRNQCISYDSSEHLKSVRGRHIAMIFQNPMGALNPLFRVGHQIRHMIRHHFKLSKVQADERIQSLFHDVGFDDPAVVFRAYPHQLSGGMAQRIMIAMALACQPDIIIADEPTTALDVSTEQKLIRLLHELHQQYGFAMILISHDIHLVSQLASRIVVLKDGHIVESGESMIQLQTQQLPIPTMIHP